MYWPHGPPPPPPTTSDSEASSGYSDSSESSGESDAQQNVKEKRGRDADAQQNAKQILEAVREQLGEAELQIRRLQEEAKVQNTSRGNEHAEPTASKSEVPPTPTKKEKKSKKYGDGYTHDEAVRRGGTPPSSNKKTKNKRKSRNCLDRDDGRKKKHKSKRG